ncbi:MAG TPA: hypothetical protein VKF59_23245 [Candidatus Dormibacteraeota bacterium]|nr:hypothetical protein [Candidatus Dormibacteraeota bacterium]
MRLLLLPGLIVACGGLVGLGLWRSGALTPPEVAAWSRVGRNHGLIDERPLSERLGRRAPFLRRFQEAADVARLLAVAGRTQSATAWVLLSAGLALLVVLAGLAVDLAGLAGGSGPLPLPPADALLFGAVAFMVRYLLLRVAAGRRQAGLEAGLSSALTEIAILTYTRQMSVEQAVDLLARAQADGWLWGLIGDERWRELAAPGPSAPGPSTRGPFGEPAFVSAASVYEQIGHSYGVPMFALLGSTMRRIDDKGLPPRTALTNLARAVGTGRLADMQVRSEQSRFRQAIPIGLMVLPLVLLIGYPAWATLSLAFR